MHTVYMAYGSNLNIEQMGQRCPRATVIGGTILKGHRLTFRGTSGSGVATIERHKGSSVPVLLWEITPQCEKALDRYEGYPRLYHKKRLDVKFEGQDIQAMAYIMNEGFPPALPGPYYYNTILQGYRDCGFDEDILNTAVQETETTGDD